MIDVQNVSKVYEMPGESLRVLDAVNLQVATGETAAVVGPSGSGKTTLLKALMGLLPVRQGTLRSTVRSGDRLRTLSYLWRNVMRPLLRS
jgi:ABC-type lipoprotein export system ATPase subunit